MSHPAKIISFQPAARPGFSLPEIEGEITAYGLVLHRSLISIREKLGFFDVSDPVTGCLVCHGEFPGRLGAVCALVDMAAKWSRQPVKFRAKLEENRRNF